MIIKIISQLFKQVIKYIKYRYIGYNIDINI